MEQRPIEKLSRIVADQIAAGEVVERPGSVVKELIENSLDAGANRVQVDINGGGVSRLRVWDNGIGIPAREVTLAFERHATSKIRQLEDLDVVSSYGFRGEALPSIASVAKVTVRTRTADDVAGRLVAIEGGKIVQEREVGCPVGTDIEVADLFFNTPARLKFLKKESTEASHVAEALVRAAACRPDVAFTMKSNGRRVRDLPRVEKLEERISQLFGGEKMVRAEGEEHGIGVLAILGPPERARAGAGSLYTYVANRFIRDKTLLGAVSQAFGGTLERGRYPVGMILLTPPAKSFDVNVHPQKTEVRFADTPAVFRAVVRVVGEMVSRSPWSLLSSFPDRIREAPAQPYRPPGRLVPPPSTPGRRPGDAPLPAGFISADPSSRHSADRGVHLRGPDHDLAAVQDASPAPSSVPVQAPVQDASPPAKVFTRSYAPAQFAGLSYLGQAKGTFLLFEDDADLVVVDQHAAHERVVYERLRSQLQHGGIPSQRLLMPHNVDLGPADAERIAGYREQLQSLGLEVSQTGPDRVSIRGIPAELHQASPDRLLADMVLALEEGREGSRGEQEDKILATMACHGSIRGGQMIDGQELRALLRQMDQIDFAGHCPHGRPVVARIPWQEIRRRVGRS